MQNANWMSALVEKPPRIAVATSLLWIPLCIGASAPSFAQEAAQGTEDLAMVAAPVVPQQVRYTGKLAARTGETLESEFRIYAAAEGGDPLWSESQRVTVGEGGSFSVLLGSASPAGLPQTVFAGGAARWLSVSVERGAEQERVPLCSVPYAMKSADAESLSGHAVSDFVTQEQLAELSTASGQKSAATPDAQPNTFPTVTGSGTANTIPLWTTAGTQGNSVITQLGSNIGINLAAPSATLDVAGSATIRGTLSVGPVAPATTAGGQNSQHLNLTADAWSTATNSALAQTFDWVAAAVGNNTASPSGALYLQFQSGTGARTNLFDIDSSGVFHWAPSQTFPGTIGSVTATGPVTATTTSGAVSLGLNESALVTDIAPAITPAIAPTLNEYYAQLTAQNIFTAGFQQFQGSVDIIGTPGGGDGLLTIDAEGSQVDASAIYASNSTAYPTIYSDGNQGGVGIAGYGAAAIPSIGAIGVLGGFDGISSSTFKRDNDTLAYSAGVWADNPGLDVTAGLFATADGANAAVFENNSTSAPTIYVANLATNGPTGNAVLVRAEGADGVCSINQGGSMACTGQLKNIVATHDARQLETYSTQSAENWMEDYGSGALEKGVGVIKIDPAFAETVSQTADYHVFLTPNGDSKGLYVINKTPTSFEVRESGGGTSTLMFDYKIVAKRRGLESQRLVDVTDRMKLEAAASHFKPLPEGPPANPHQPGISRAARRLASQLTPNAKPGRIP